MKTTLLFVALGLLGAAFCACLPTPPHRGTVVMMIIPYCGGAAPPQEMWEASFIPHLVPNTTFYVMPSQGNCAEDQFQLNEHPGGNRPRGSVAVHTDSTGHFAIPNGLPPGNYCLATEQAVSCQRYETAGDGQIPACFTVGSNRQLPDTLIIQLLCGTLPRP